MSRFVFLKLILIALKMTFILNCFFAAFVLLLNVSVVCVMITHFGRKQGLDNEDDEEVDDDNNNAAAAAATMTTTTTTQRNDNDDDDNDDVFTFLFGGASPRRSPPQYIYSGRVQPPEPL